MPKRPRYIITLQNFVFDYDTIALLLDIENFEEKYLDSKGEIYRTQLNIDWKLRISGGEIYCDEVCEIKLDVREITSFIFAKILSEVKHITFCSSEDVVIEIDSKVFQTFTNYNYTGFSSLIALVREPFPPSTKQMENLAEWLEEAITISSRLILSADKEKAMSSTRGRFWPSIVRARERFSSTDIVQSTQRSGGMNWGQFKELVNRIDIELTNQWGNDIIFDSIPVEIFDPLVEANFPAIGLSLERLITCDENYSAEEDSARICISIVGYEVLE